MQQLAKHRLKVQAIRGNLADKILQRCRQFMEGGLQKNVGQIHRPERFLELLQLRLVEKTALMQSPDYLEGIFHQPEADFQRVPPRFPEHRLDEAQLRQCLLTGNRGITLRKTSDGMQAKQFMQSKHCLPMGPVLLGNLSGSLHRPGQKLSLGTLHRCTTQLRQERRVFFQGLPQSAGMGRRACGPGKPSARLMHTDQGLNIDTTGCHKPLP